MRSYRWQPRNPRWARALRTLLAWQGLVAALACGCASPGEPSPRHPIVPQTVGDLEARQQGGAVLLSFTVPTQSTRDESLAMAPAIEIYRGEATAGKTAETAGTELVYTIPGEIADSYMADGRVVYRDMIDPGTSAGTQRVYLVRTRAARNRASEESNRAALRVYPPPAPVGDIDARAAGQSVTVTWASVENASYRVYREEIAPESVAAAGVDAARAIVRMPLVQVAQVEPSGVGAAAGGVSPAMQYQDENVELGHAYLYIVRSVAEFGAEKVESEDSAPAAITVAAASRPAAPQDVVAVAAPASGTSPAYVALSWGNGPEPGVAGYAVYRSEEEGVRGIRVNRELAGSLTYKDESVVAGRQYFYSVTAVDAAGVESDASEQREAQAPGSQP